MHRGYGYYPDEEEGGLLTGGGLKSFRKGLRGPSVPSLTWGIRKLAREGTGERLKKSKWWGFMQKALQQAREDYKNSLTEEEKARYEERREKQQSQKERREAKKKIVLNALQKLKARTKEDTAANIARALRQEGNLNVRVLRAAMKVLYPELRKLSKEELHEEMKKYTVRGYTIPPKERYKYKGTSYIGFEGLEEGEEKKS
jgi:hypothetical protein